MFPQLGIDEFLVSQCQLKATGANIHNVRGALNVYTAANEMLIRHPKDKEKWEEMIQRKESQLRKFLATGTFVPES